MTETPANVEANLQSSTPENRPVQPAVVSGRQLVAVFAAIVVVLWLTLFGISRLWRAQHLQRVEYGMAQVLPKLDQLEMVSPRQADPERWEAAIADTRAMLASVLQSGVLSREQMESLGGRLDERLAHSTDATILDDLAQIWLELTRAAGHRINGYRERRRQEQGFRATDPGSVIDSLILLPDPTTNLEEAAEPTRDWEAQIRQRHVQTLRLTLDPSHATADLERLTFTLALTVKAAVNGRLERSEALRQVDELLTTMAKDSQTELGSRGLKP